MKAKPEASEFQCLLIADISGYTEYLSGVEIDHAQEILADLVGAVVSSLRPGFRLAKLEGDAAFCFAPADEIDGSLLLDTIEHCYFSFRRRRRDVRQATSCECNACSRIPDLNLKFVAHHGTALRQKVAGREELFGPDVILVHRLLKNSVVEHLGVGVYALISDALAQAMDIDPQPLGMREHADTYEHFGEVKSWVYDLEARWQEEDARQRVFLGSGEGFVEVDKEVDAPPQVVWEFLTTPGRRLQWQNVIGVTAVEQQPRPGGRRGVGMKNHCMHGTDALIEEILDWRPFDYLTHRSTLPDGPSYLQTVELEPTSRGTLVHVRFGRPTKVRNRQMLEQIRSELLEAATVTAEVLKTEVGEETEARLADRAEPPIPAPKAGGLLAGLQPIRIVG